jgi:hypothetical protein
VEKVRENLITYSEDLSNAAYTNDPTDGSVTITANYGVAPNGTNTADRVQITKGTSYSQIYQAKSVTAGVEYSFSLYLKSLSGTPTITILYNENGAVGKATLTSSWVRYTFTYNAPLTSTNYPMIALYTGDSASCDILAWGLQFETGVPTDYIATTSSAVSVGPVSGLPRLDYSGGATCPSLILEGQRTNVITYSEQINNAAFVGAAPVTANAGSAPDGTTSADSVKETATTAFHIKGQSQSYTSGTAYTFSFFAKPDGRNFARVLYGNAPFTTNESAYFNLLTGDVSASSNVSASMVSYGNGWWRCIVVATANASASDAIYFGPARNMTDGYNQYAGDASLGVLFWGIQQENSATYATSYIPTLSTAVTRVAESCSKTSATALIGQTEGTFFAEVDFTDTNKDQMYLTLSDGTSSNRIHIGYDASGDFIYCNIRESNVIQGLLTSAVGPSSGIKKIAVGYKLNDYVMYINGTQVAVDYNALVPACSRVDVGNYFLAGYEYPIKQALLFKTRLSNASLASLTTL